MRKLVLMVVVLAALGSASVANADPGGGKAVPTPVAPTQSIALVPDPGWTITTDPSKAASHRSLAPSPNALCGTCTGGGNVSGCATVYANNSDGYGNWVKAFYHWCWLNGSISSNYGWGDDAACWGFCNFLGWNYNFDFRYGHQDKATFRDVSGGIFHIDSADAACVAVDGWGNSWFC